MFKTFIGKESPSTLDFQITIYLLQVLDILT